MDFAFEGLLGTREGTPRMIILTFRVTKTMFSGDENGVFGLQKRCF
jgi:hypothetical protein